MPGPYPITLYENVIPFEYSGHTFQPGETYLAADACEAKAFISAFKQANQGNLVEKTSGIYQAIEEECPVSETAVISPSPDTGSPASEVPLTDQDPDDAKKQGAPDPPVAAIIEELKPVGDSNGEEGSFPEPTRPQEGKKDKFQPGEKPGVQTNAGDPVDLFNGAFYLEEMDLEIPGTLIPMALVRFYRSGKPYFGPFGWNWDHNFNLYLRKLSNGDIALWRNLHEEIFRSNQENYESPRGVFELLKEDISDPDHFIIEAPHGKKMYFYRPPHWTDPERIPLQIVRDRYGNELKFLYNEQNQLRRVQDQNDFYFEFFYDACELCVGIKDQSNRLIRYQHNEESLHLTAVLFPTIKGHPDGIRKCYHYENPWTPPQLRHNIVRVEDHLGNCYVENVYNQDPASWDFARIMEQNYGGFLFQFRYTLLQIVPPDPLYINIPNLRVEVLNPAFSLETYTFNYRGDLIDRRYRLVRDQSFRVVVHSYEYDEQGNKTRETSADGSSTIHVYDSSNTDPRMRGNLLKIEKTATLLSPSPSRIIWSGLYESRFQMLKREMDERGKITEYQYDFDLMPAPLQVQGNLLQITENNQNAAGIEYWITTRFQYNQAGQIIRQILPDGTVNENYYGMDGISRGKLIRQIFDAGRLNITKILEYDLFGNNHIITDGNGNKTRFEYNELGLIEKIIHPDLPGEVPVTDHFFYDGDRKLIKQWRSKGDYRNDSIDYIEDIFERDILGNLVNVRTGVNTPESRKISMCHNYQGQMEMLSFDDGSKIILKYDERNKLLEKEHIGKDGRFLIEKMIYDLNGQLFRKYDVNGQRTEYHYDGFGRLSKLIQTNNTFEKYVWGLGDVLLKIDVHGDDGTGTERILKQKTFQYDIRSRKTQEMVNSFSDQPESGIWVQTRYLYDDLDRLKKVIDHRGSFLEMEYDGMGRPMKYSNAFGHILTRVFDGNSNLIQEMAIGESENENYNYLRLFTYDTRNRLIAVGDQYGAVKAEYDSRNLLIRLTDQQGTIQKMEYDSQTNKIKEIRDEDGMAITLQWKYDNMSRITSFIDATGQTTQYEYDSLGRLSGTSFPNTLVSSRLYNEKGQLAKEKLNDGIQFLYLYDVFGRLKTIKNTQVNNGILPIDDHEYKYDGLDRLINAKKGVSNIIRKYDSQNRIIKESNEDTTFFCQYDENTGTMEKRFPDSRIEIFEHRPDGILKNIKTGSPGLLGHSPNSQVALVAGFAGINRSIRYSNGVELKNTLDSKNRILETTYCLGIDKIVFGYQYNRGDLLQIEKIPEWLGGNQFYTFDRVQRLTGSFPGLTENIETLYDAQLQQQNIDSVSGLINNANNFEKFIYNAADARLIRKFSGGATEIYTYLDGHRLMQAGNTNITYQKTNVKSSGNARLIWDSLGRIAKIEKGSYHMMMDYDSLGRLIRIKRQGGPDSKFKYIGKFIEQEDQDGIPIVQYTTQPGTGLTLSLHVPGKTIYPLFDQRYNLRILADSEGNIIQSFRYSAFGIPTVFDSNGDEIAISQALFPPVFGGQKYLPEFNLYMSPRRVYDPQTATYLSPDPGEYGDSQSMYVYCAQDPVNNLDPEGAFIPLLAVFAVGGALAGAGYSYFDSKKNPKKYSGWKGGLRVAGNVLGGAAVGASALVAGEMILAVGGTGALVTSSSGVGVTTLTTGQTFALFGTSSAASGGLLRHGFHQMFPEYVNPVTAGSITKDYIMGGTMGSILKIMAAPSKFDPDMVGVHYTHDLGTTPGGAIINGLADNRLMKLIPEEGILGKLGIKKPVFDPAIDIRFQPVGGRTVEQVLAHEMQHAKDFINWPQISYVVGYSRIPGRGILNYILEARGYYAELGWKGILPWHVFGSMRDKILWKFDSRHYLAGELTFLSLMAYIYGNSYFGKDKHPNQTAPDKK